MLADENVHAVVVDRLRRAGLDVEWVAESGFGAADQDLLGRPDIAGLIFITFDRDFGDLIFNQGFPVPRAILYSRLGRADPRHAADRIVAVIERGVEAGYMITITKDGERSKPFPAGVEYG